jgi:lactam utilization protein B
VPGRRDLREHRRDPLASTRSVEANAVYRNGDAEAMAKAEEIVRAHVASHGDIMAVPAAERQAAHARF